MPKSGKPACARLPLVDYVHVQVRMQVQARLTESSVFQVRKFQLRAYSCVTCSSRNVCGGRGFRKVRDEITRNRLERVSTSLSRVALAVVCVA